MFKSIDHIVIVVPELEAAIEHYSCGAGFTVVRGGKHSIGSHNALIAFADGAYIELIAFLAGGTNHPWQAALEKSGGGLIDFCMVTDNLEIDVAAFRKAGAQIGDPYAMTRDRPDGYRLSWVLAVPERPWNGRLPFLIRDETPRDERVPHEREHRNGVKGIQEVTVAVENPEDVARIYASALGRTGALLQRPDLDAAGIEFTIGPHRVQLVAPKSDRSVIAKWLRVHGESPFEAKLIATGPASGQIDPMLLGRARLGIA